MSDRNTTEDIVVYVVLGIVALILINLLMNWLGFQYMEIIKKAWTRDP